MGFKQKATRGVLWLTAQKGATQVISFVVFTILSRLLDPDAFGLIAMATLFIAFIDILLDQGFSQAIVQRAEVEPVHLNTAFWMTIIIGIFFTAAGFLGSSFVAGLFREPRVEPLVRWLSASLFLSSLCKTQQAILSRELAFGKLAIRTFIAEMTGGIVGVIMAFQGFGVWSLVGRNLSRDLVAVVVLWRVSDWRPRLRVSLDHFRDLFPFGINIIGINLISFFNRFADRFFIGIFLDATVLGYYTVGARFIELMSSLFLQSIQGVSFSLFSRLQHEFDRLRNAFYQSTWYTGIIAVPSFLGICIVAPELIAVFFGTKWLPSIPILRILALIGIAQVVHFLSWSLLVAFGKPSWRLSLTIVGAMVNVLAIRIGLHWGIEGVAVGYVISSYSLLPLTIWLINRLIHIDMKRYGRQFAIAFIGSLGMLMTVFLLGVILNGKFSDTLRLGIYLISGVIAYGLILRWMDPSIGKKLGDLFKMLLPDSQLDSP